MTRFPENLKAFANNLAKLRKEKGLSQKELSNTLGKKISASAISDYENEKYFPKITSLALLAKYFDVSADFLLGLSKIDKRK